MHQVDPGFELGIEHDRAVHVTDGAVGRALEHLDQAGEMQQGPHHQTAQNQEKSHPFQGVVTIGQTGHGGHGDPNLLQLHAAIVSAARETQRCDHQNHITATTITTPSPAQAWPMP